MTYLAELRPRVRDCPLFAGMSEDDIKTLAEHARPVVVPSGRLFEQGGHADRFWLVETGRIALDLDVPGRAPLVVEELGPGEVIGWSWLEAPYQWDYGALVVEPVTALEFEADPIRALGEFDPELALRLHERFLRVVVQRLKATRRRLIAVWEHEHEQGKEPEDEPELGV